MPKHRCQWDNIPANVLIPLADQIDATVSESASELSEGTTTAMA